MSLGHSGEAQGASPLNISAGKAHQGAHHAAMRSITRCDADVRAKLLYFAFATENTRRVIRPITTKLFSKRFVCSSLGLRVVIKASADSGRSSHSCATAVAALHASDVLGR